MPKRRSPKNQLFRSVVVGGVMLLAGSVAACSWLPDAINPLTYLDDAPEAPIPGDDEEFPTLSDVPDAPPPASSPEDIERMVEGLVADRKRARYTDQTLRSRYADDVAPSAAPLDESDGQPEGTRSHDVVPGKLDLQVDAAPPSPYAVASATERIEAPVVDQSEPPLVEIEPASAAVQQASARAVAPVEPVRRRLEPATVVGRDVAAGVEEIEPASAAVLAARSPDELPEVRPPSPVVEEGSTDSLAVVYDEKQLDLAAEPAQASGTKSLKTAQLRAPKDTKELRPKALDQLSPAAGSDPLTRPSETERMQDLKAMILRRLEESERQTVSTAADLRAPEGTIALTSPPPAETERAAPPEDQVTRYEAALALEIETERARERKAAERARSAGGLEFDTAALNGEAPITNGQAAVSFLATTIPFADGSFRLSEADRSAIRRVVSVYHELGGTTVRVVGHASRSTPNMDIGEHKLVNFQMSLDRANAVGTELARAGIPTEALRIDARSDNEPLTYEYMPVGEAENRRAEIFIEY